MSEHYPIINESSPIPVYVLAGFLGSGKTTLLARLLAQAEREGRKAAVVMNELGEVNLDGLELGDGVPMAELLSGCICCTVRGDLGMEILRLVDEHQPDVIYVECTGAANPMELLDGITEASLLLRAEFRGIVTVMDAAQLLQAHAKGKGQTYRLMMEQLRAASFIALNKLDLVTEEERLACLAIIRESNAVARIVETVRCEFGLQELESLHAPVTSAPSHPEGDHNHASADHHHHTHAHVMVYTQYLDRPLDSERFERFMAALPHDIYRAKGILTFTDTSSRFLFQYAYRQLDCMKILPQREVPDVAVFIGEHFDRDALQRQLQALLDG